MRQRLHITLLSQFKQKHISDNIYMNFFKNIFKKKSVIDDNARYTYFGASQFSTQRELSDTDFIRSTAYKASDLRAKAMTTLQFYAGLESDNEVTALPYDHEANRILYQPQGSMTLSDILLLIVQELDFRGNAVFLPIKSDLTSKLIGIELVPWARVRVDAIGGQVYYSFATGSGTYTRKYLENEILHIKNLSTLSKSNNRLDPKILKIGLASVENCVKDIEAEIAYKKFVASLFDNNGVAPLIAEPISDDGVQLDERTKKTFIDYLRSIISPDRVLGYMPQNTKLTELAGTRTASNSNVLNGEESKRNIAEAFHVPLSKIAGEYENRATANVIEKQFYTDSIFPTANIIAQSMTQYLRKHLGISNLVITYDKPDFLSDDITGLQNLAMAGIISRSEVRQRLGFSAEEL